jgi:hypothetical protein
LGAEGVEDVGEVDGYLIVIAAANCCEVVFARHPDSQDSKNEDIQRQHQGDPSDADPACQQHRDGLPA